MATTNPTFKPPETLALGLETIVHPPAHSDSQDDSDDSVSEYEDAETINEHESNRLKMLESHSQANLKSRGEKT